MGEDADDAADDDYGEKKRKGKERKGKEGPWPLKCTAHSQLGDRQFGAVATEASAPKLKTSQRENCQPGN